MMSRLFLVFLVIVAWVSPTWADKRAALVIGNSTYEHAQRLTNPANDALAIAATLRSIGFNDVDVAIDQTIDDMRETVRKFGEKTANVDLALVYFAGHGMEMGGKNYLLPVDAKLKSDRDLDFEALTLNLVLRAIEPAKRLRIVILDACRNNPFASQMRLSGSATRSVSRGLVRIEPIGNTLVAYAAKDGTVAEDGAGDNSPFAAALLEYLGTAGLEISLLFRRVRDRVLERTNRRQEPFVYGSLGGEAIYLVPPANAKKEKAKKEILTAKRPEPTTVRSGPGQNNPSDDSLRFDAPVPHGAYPVRGKSIQELAASIPLNPPIVGLQEALWKKSCQSCHQWNRERLCEQGKSYINAPNDLMRHPHPYGGAYKVALMRWSMAGCK